MLDRRQLLEDIIENLMLQPHGFKARFVYAFNPKLRFRLSGSDDESQTKLLDHLVETKAIESYKEPNYSNIDDRFFSVNAKKFKTRQLSLFIDGDSINRYLYDFKKSTLGRSSMSNKVQIDQNGLLYIPQVGMQPVLFSASKDPFNILRAILVNDDSRVKLWRKTELEQYLDGISRVEKPSDLLITTINNINRKIQNRTGFKKFLIMKKSGENLDVHLNDQLV